MVFETLRQFGVSVYAMEDRPKNGRFAPSFHIIDHVIYHTSLDVPELVPASGLERATRAFRCRTGSFERDDARATAWARVSVLERGRVRSAERGSQSRTASDAPRVGRGSTRGRPA